jgi:hypothetical protein
VTLNKLTASFVSGATRRRRLTEAAGGAAGAYSRARTRRARNAFQITAALDGPIGVAASVFLQ